VQTFPIALYETQRGCAASTAAARAGVRQQGPAQKDGHWAFFQHHGGSVAVFFLRRARLQAASAAALAALSLPAIYGDACAAVAFGVLASGA